MKSAKVFKSKTIEDLYSEIYDSHNHNSSEIMNIILEVKKHIGDEASAAVLTPMLSNLVNNKIRNTQLLIDLTKIIKNEKTVEVIEEKIDIPKEELNELLNNIIKEDI